MSEPSHNPEPDKTFRTVRDAEAEWALSDIGLPPGNKTKRLHLDPAVKRRVSKVYFPPGYIEPKHTHQGWHALVVLKGRMCVDGKDLRPGDYVFGWDVAHGPFEYPDGFEGFSVSMGEDMHHHWDEAEFLAYQRQWAPETDEGRRGCEEFDRWRREQAEALRRKQQ
jgi:hypothetical protein